VKQCGIHCEEGKHLNVFKFLVDWLVRYTIFECATKLFTIFVKPQQWPTPSESIAIYCLRKLVSCVTHLQSCAKVDIWNKKKKLRTVAKNKTQDYKIWRLQNLSTVVTPPLNTATTLFNEHRSQRPESCSQFFVELKVLDYELSRNQPTGLCFPHFAMIQTFTYLYHSS